MSNLKSVYWIIARIGGFDGVSIQTFEYMKLLNRLGIKVNIVTGLEQTEFGAIDYGQNQRFLVERLSFKHPDSAYLYKNSFADENEDNDNYQKQKIKWEEVFKKHKDEIKKSIEEVLLKEKDIPIFVHNMISLRHMHPAAAVAIKELIEKYPDRVFINFAPDSDWERPERLKRVRHYVKETISSDSADFSKPYNYNNLYHLVLNRNQRKVFKKTYEIPSKKIFEIPDFLDFESPELETLDSPEKDFLDYLAKNCAYIKNGELNYKKCDINEATIFFLCPVRPIRRKKIKASIFFAYHFKINTQKKVAIVLTHPEGDDVDYFNECVSFANNLNLNFIFLGRSLKLSNKEKKKDVWTLNDVYKNMAALNSIGMVTSDSGGWENAINELLRAGIPLLVNPKLESYVPITQSMKINIFGLHLTKCYESIKNLQLKISDTSDARAILDIKKFISWVEEHYTVHSDKRNKLIKHNYTQAYCNLSSESKKPDFLKLLQVITPLNKEIYNPEIKGLHAK
ncbi:MAG: hypothetical protein ISS23_03470 [Nanoarchaeota archaeon]|nr:hypothetical protein [Nanoarchaeota archaeon]